MMKFSIACWIIKLTLVLIFIFIVIIPFGSEFLDVLTNMLNTHIWDMKQLLTPIGWIIIYATILIVIEILIMFLLIYPAAKKQIEKNTRYW